MTLGIDSAGTLSFAANQSIVPVGTIRAVLILLTDNGTTTDNVTGVTINGVAMTEIALSPFAPAITEVATHHGFFMGSSIPGGTLDVDFSGSPVQTMVRYVAFTADDDVEVYDTSTGSSTSATSATVTLNGHADGVYGVAILQSNVGATGGITPDGSTTVIDAEVDYGNQTGACMRTTNLVTTTPTFTMSWTQSLDDYMILAASIREVAAASAAANQANETDLAQAVAWAPKHRLIGQASSTELAQTIAATTENEVLVAQVEEFDLAQPITEVKGGTIQLATEADTAQAIGHGRSKLIGIAFETDTAGSATAIFPVLIGQATETDFAQVIQPIGTVRQASELDRAQQVTVVGGGPLPVAEVPVLIRAPRKAGRIFHEFVGPTGEGYHPNVAEWQSEEDAPGGFRAASGLISERVFNAHRDVFQAGGMWRTFLEDGTCIFAGRLKQPDPQESTIQLNASGRANIVDREVGPILYQTHVGSELSKFAEDSDRWRVDFTTMGHDFQSTGMQFRRSPGQVPGQAFVMIPFFGRDPAFLRMRMQGQHGFLDVRTATRVTQPPSQTNSAELDVGANSENYYFTFGSVLVSADVEIDLTLLSEALPSPNTTEFTNGTDPDVSGVGIVYPDIIIIEIADHPDQSDTTSSGIVLQNIEVNGAPLGSSRRYTVGDLVEDIAARLGFPEVRESGSYDITPYELPPGAAASEALDWACVVSGKRYRILDSGAGATFEWGFWNERQWALASPWSPLRTIPEERYDAVAVPFQYPGTHGQLTDQVIVRADPSPLKRKRIAWDVNIGEPSHNRDRAIDLGAQIADELVRPRFTGDFAAAEVVGPDGQKRSAHHVNAGDVLQPWRRAEPGRLRIGRLTRFDDHVEGEFDGENRALDKLIARREKRITNRRG